MNQRYFVIFHIAAWKMCNGVRFVQNIHIKNSNEKEAVNTIFFISPQDAIFWINFSMLHSISLIICWKHCNWPRMIKKWIIHLICVELPSQREKQERYGAEKINIHAFPMTVCNMHDYKLKIAMFLSPHLQCTSDTVYFIIEPDFGTTIAWRMIDLNEVDSRQWRTLNSAWRICKFLKQLNLW